MTLALRPPVIPPDALDITAISSAHTLLVALDFDGVIAPLQDDPDSSAPLPASADAVVALAALPHTPVGYISGRNIDVLQDLSNAPTGAIFIGSHGLETDFSALDPSNGSTPNGSTSATAPAADGLPRYSTPLTAAEADTLAQLDAAFESIRSRTPEAGHGELRIERKPLGRTAHTRGTSAERAAFFEAELTALAARMPQLRSFAGHAMTEFAVRMETKGHGLARMLEATGADAVVFLGDDTTDEDAFAYLNDRTDIASLPVKVGTQATCAPFRVADPEAVSTFLARLAADRGRHLGSGSTGTSGPVSAS